MCSVLNLVAARCARRQYWQMNLNKVFILGNLTRDPESRALPSGQNLATFSVATNRIWNKDGAKQQDTQFHNVVVFGKMADVCAKYLNRGKMVLVEGRIQTRSWDAQDGTKKYRTEIVAEAIQLGPRSSGGAGGSEASFSAAPAQQKSGLPAKTASVDKEDIPIIEQETEEVDVSDIPF